MKKLKWITKKEDTDRMKRFKVKNLNREISAENWMKDKLSQTDLKWTRQAIWGFRIFDFWNHEKGIAVEVDGPTHNEKYDEYRDRYNYLRSGIIILRVRNFNEQDAQQALNKIKSQTSWVERRKQMGISGPKNIRTALASGQGDLFR